MARDPFDAFHSGAGSPHHIGMRLDQPELAGEMLGEGIEHLKHNLSQRVLLGSHREMDLRLFLPGEPDGLGIVAALDSERLAHPR